MQRARQGLPLGQQFFFAFFAAIILSLCLPSAMSVFPACRLIAARVNLSNEAVVEDRFRFYVR